MEPSIPKTVSKESFSDLYETRQPQFVSGSTLQQSPGGHGLAFPSWTMLPMSYLAPALYDVTAFKVQGYRDHGHWRPVVLQWDVGYDWELSEAELPNLPAFLQTVQGRANDVVEEIAHLRYGTAVDLLRSMKEDLWVCFRGNPLDLWINVHLAHVLLRAALTSLANAKKFLAEASCIFNECIDMPPTYTYAFGRILSCSANLGRAWMYLIWGDMKEARQDIGQIESISLDGSDALSKKIQVKWAMAAISLAAGDLEKAEKFLHEVGPEFETSGGSANEFQIAALDLHILRMKGKWDTALYICAKHVLSTEPFNEFDSMTDTANIRMRQLYLGNIGDVWFALGACREAMQYYQEASKSEDFFLKGAALVGQANVHMRLHKEASGQHLMDAEKLYKEALSFFSKLQHIEGQVIVNCNLGTLYMAKGLFDPALQHYDLAKKLGVKFRLRAASVELDCKIGLVHVQLKQWSKAITLLETSQVLAKDRQEPMVQAWIEHQFGQCLLKRSEEEKGKARTQSLDKAEGHFINAIQHFAMVQCNTTCTEHHYERLWLILFEEQKETYALLQWCLARKQKASDAVVWGERGRTRALVWDKWDEVLSAIRHDDLDFDSALMQKLHLDEFDGLKCEAAWECLKEWRSTCTLENAVIVEYTICTGYGLLIYILDGSSKAIVCCRSFAELGKMGSVQNTSDIENLVTQTIKVLHLKSRDSEQEEAQLLLKLSKLLIWPVEEELQNRAHLRSTSQLIFIPHEHLYKVPFAALYSKRGLRHAQPTYLIEKYTLSCIESIRSLVRSSVLYKSLRVHGRHSGRPAGESAALVVGIKEYKAVAEEFNDLRYAEDEAKEVVKILQERWCKEATPVLGCNATKNVIRRKLCDAQLVHFATHAVITNRYEEGGIVFALPQEKSTRDEPTTSFTSWDCEALPEGASPSSSGIIQPDGCNESEIQRTMRRFNLQKELADEVMLVADEISDMKLKAQLVVLSACQTGNGVIAGEGVAGLGRALTKAGVPCTVLSLWPVDDDASMCLMVALYKNLSEGQQVANSLQESMVHMIKERSPADPSTCRWRVKHWAAFLPFGLPSVQLEV